MAFQLSPGINISEIDLTNVTPAVATTEGAIAGVFRWGPTGERILVTSEKELVSRFGKPATYYTDSGLTSTWTNHETFFSAANFLSYSDALFVTRVLGESAETATNTNFDALYAGKLGDSLQVSFCTAGNFNAAQRTETLTIQPSATSGVATGYTTSAGITAYANIGDRITLTNNTQLVISAITTVSDAAAGSAVTFSGASVTTAVASLTVGQVYTITSLGDTTQLSWNTAAGTTGVTYAVGSTFTCAAVGVGTGAALNATTGGVIAGTDIFTKVAHGLTTGQAVQYSRGSGTAIEGLDEGGFYHVIRVNADNFKLATTLANANAGTAIDILQVGSGTGHTVTPVTTYKSNLTFTTKYTGATAYASTFTTQWGDANLFDSSPAAGGVHIVVRDVDGEISGTAGTVLERWENVSTTAGSTKYDGSTNFIVDVLEQGSAWIAVSPAQSVLIKNGTFSSGVTLTGGDDGEDETEVSIGALAAGYDLYVDASDVDISFVIQGKARGTTLANYIIDNICEVRRDCVAFISPELTDTTVDAIIGFTSTLSSSTYAVVDSGYKYQYDKYADVYRWIPLNGDIAGLCARTDDVRDPWFSPAGYNRGNVKNVVKLLVNPSKTQRDLLYKNSINPVITQPGQGTVLFGDKTFTSTVSAFDRINVRRLFIVLEKTIGTAAKSTIFEFNDDFTRAQFKNLVEPFLRDVQGRRGIYDFRVVCDETNNTSQVIDANQFVGDIYIKPARSINFIQLNFVAVRSGVEFSEIVGQI
jgi:hypothetical protein